MRGQRYTAVFMARMVAAAVVLSVGISFIALSWFDPLGLEQKRIDRSTKQATTILLCAQMLTYDDRLAQLEAIIDRVGLEGLTRNERDVWESISKAQGRLEAAEAKLGADCIPGDSS